MPETTTHIPLPGDEWAEMADPGDLTGGDVETVIAEIDLGDVDLAGDAAQMGRMMLRVLPQLNPLLVATLCREWSLTDGGEPLPVTAAAVRRQRMTLLAPLYTHVAPARAEVLQALNMGGGADPKSAAS